MRDRVWVPLIAAAVGVVLVAAGCSGERLPELQSADDLTEGVWTPETPEDGDCAFDFRAEVALVDPSDGSLDGQVEVPWPGDSFSSPAARVIVGERRVFVPAEIAPSGYRSGIVALDIATGDPAWARWFEERATVVGTVGGGVLLSDREGTFLLEGATGETAWRAAGSATSFDPMGIPLAGPIGEVVLLVDGTVLRGVDRETGQTEWETALGGDELTLLSAQSNLALLRSWPATVHAVDPASGQLVWDFEVPASDVYVVTAQALTSGRIAITTTFSPMASDMGPPADGSSERLVVYDPTSDSVIVDQQLMNGPGGQIGTIAGTDIAYADLVGERGLFSAETGERLALSPPNDVYAVHQLDAGQLLVGGTEIRAVDLSASSDWTFSIGDDVGLSPPTLGPDAVYVGSTASGSAEVVDDPAAGSLYALDPTTGDVMWTTQFRDGIRLAPALTDAGLVVVSSDPVIGCD